jgi:hypothetical protein
VGFELDGLVLGVFGLFGLVFGRTFFAQGFILALHDL